MKSTSFFQAGVIAAFIILAVVGLFTFATYTGSGGSASFGTVVIWGTFPATRIQQSISAFAQLDERFKSVSYVEKRSESFTDEYVNAVAAGRGPDILIISHEDIARLRTTLYQIPYDSVSQRSYFDTFADGATVYLGSTGSYGIPFAVDPLVLYYNRNILSSSGIAAPPTTWEAVAGLPPKVAQISDRQDVTRGLIALGTYANVHNARGILSALFIQAGIPISLETSQGALRASLTSGKNAAGVAPAEAVVRFYTSFANPAQSTYTWNAGEPDSRQAFIAGDLALYLGYASELPFIRAANPNLSFDVAKFPQPASASARATYGRIYAFAIPRASSNLSGAFTAAVTLSAKEPQGILASAAGSIAPARRDLLSELPGDPYGAIVYGEALISHGWLSPEPALTDSVFAAMIQGVISGTTRLSEAVAKAEQSLNAAYGL